MPYGDLKAKRVQRFAELADPDLGRCTIEEREEYEPHIAAGNVVFAGVDCASILEDDALLLLIDVAAVEAEWRTPATLRAMAFDPGSMGPKIEAACAFVEETGGLAAIGSLEDAGAILAGQAGTAVSTDVAETAYNDRGDHQHRK